MGTTDWHYSLFGFGVRLKGLLSAIAGMSDSSSCVFYFTKKKERKGDSIIKC